MVLQPTADNISRCATALIQGQLIGMPTETVYGLAANALDQQAVESIYRVKGRPAGHPLIIHVSGAASLGYWVDTAQLNKLSESYLQILTDQFWPGPLTIILPRAKSAAAYACGSQTTVGLRCPAHPVAQLLLQAFEQRQGKGVAAPSANRFGKVSPTQANHVEADLGSNAPFTLDGGESEWGIESTIVDLSGEAVRILRPGSITAEQIGSALQIDVKAVVAQTFASQTPEKSIPVVPGSLASHYAPNTPVELVAGGSLQFRASGLAQVGEPVAVMAFSARPESLRLYVNLKWFQMPKDATEFGHQLYAHLRSIDQLQLERLLIELPQGEPAWRAVNDRLLRCAYPLRSLNN